MNTDAGAGKSSYFNIGHWSAIIAIPIKFPIFPGYFQASVNLPHASACGHITPMDRRFTKANSRILDARILV